MQKQGGGSREVEPLQTIDQARKFLGGMSATWMKTQDEIPYVRIGRRKFFRMEDLRAFIDKNVRGIAR